MTIDGISLDFKLSSKMIVFSHGFGVRRDSRGMFTDIISALPAEYGYVLFDYYDVTGDSVRITSLKQQTQRLSKVLEWVRNQEGVTTIHLIAHSMGSVAAAIAKVKVNGTVLFLAPPMDIARRIYDYFTRKPGARCDGGDWIVPRNDNTTSIIPIDIFEEFKLLNASVALVSYAVAQPFTLIVPDKDDLLPGVDYRELSSHPNVNVVTVNNSNHNFTGKSRHELVNIVCKKLAG